MPWEKTCSMFERLKFINAFLEGESMAELCRQFEVSRKTGYKWLARYDESDPLCLLDQSRTPLHHPNAVPREVVDEILKLRGKKMKRGPLKLLAQLQQTHPHLALPAASTVAEILKRHGLSAPRRKRNHATPSAQPLSSAVAANDIWCVDFKGWFLCGNGIRCDPLTISDAVSRYFMRCQAMTG
jgi:putative transposase